LPFTPAINHHRSSKTNHLTHSSKKPISSINQIRTSKIKSYSTPVFNRYQCLTDNSQPITSFNIDHSSTICTTDKKLQTFKRNSQSYDKLIRNKSQKNSNSTQKPVKPLSPTINAIFPDESCGPKAIISAVILSKSQPALLDTGSQINAISQHKLPPDILKNLAPSDRIITSYTGNEVDIMGTFITDIKLGKINLTNCYFYVSRDDRRTIIGTPALMSNKIIINLSENTITQDDKSEFLESMENMENITAAELGLTESIPARQPPPLQMQSKVAVKIPKKSTKFIQISARHSVDRPAYFATLDAFDHNMDHGILVGKSVSILNTENPNCIIRLC